jgi:IS30 family transposase
MAASLNRAVTSKLCCLARRSVSDQDRYTGGAARKDRRCCLDPAASADIEDRAIPGHWEGDLLSGSKNSHIVTLVERYSRFTSLIKVPNKETATVVAALTRQIRKLPAALRRSLTWDRGHEMAKHKAFTVATDVNVYFCDPHSPWQRGTNENTNRLLRQYFPRGDRFVALLAVRPRQDRSAPESTSARDIGIQNARL